MFFFVKKQEGQRITDFGNKMNINSGLNALFERLLHTAAAQNVASDALHIGIDIRNSEFSVPDFQQTTRIDPTPAIHPYQLAFSKMQFPRYVFLE